MMANPVSVQPGHYGHARDMPSNDEVAIPMPRPSGGAGCPPGMEYLLQLDQVIIKQQIELLEVLTGWETNNRYRLFNSLGQQAFFAREESSCLQRQCCGSGREFNIHITDNANQEVIRIERPLKFCSGCCWCANVDCCSQELTIKDGQGQICGFVRQRTSGWIPHYMIYDSQMQAIGRLKGPCCICNCPCCEDIPFPITDPDETVTIGEVTKQWSGMVKECFTDANTFSVTFPVDLDVRLKAAFLGAAFLIDYNYFEHNDNGNGGG